LLQIAYGHVQMILYRPFLRSVLGSPTNDSESERSSACAIACVKAARQVVLLLEQLQDHGFLNGSYWFTIYTLYSAVLWLLVYILSDDAEPDMPAFVQAARSARRILCGLAPRSAIAERCATSLSVCRNFCNSIQAVSRPSVLIIYSRYSKSSQLPTRILPGKQLGS